MYKRYKKQKNKTKFLMSYSDSEKDLSDSDFTPEGAYKKKLTKRQKLCQEEPILSVKEAAEGIAEILENLEITEVLEAVNMALSWLGLDLDLSMVTEQKRKSVTLRQQ